MSSAAITRPYGRLLASLTFGNGETILLRTSLPGYLSGRPLFSTEVAGQIRVVEVTRAGRSLVPEPSTVVMDGDLVTFAVAVSALDTLRGFLDRELGT